MMNTSWIHCKKLFLASLLYFLVFFFYYQNDKKCVRNWRANFFSLPYGCVSISKRVCRVLLLLLLLISVATKKSRLNSTEVVFFLYLSFVRNEFRSICTQNIAIIHSLNEFQCNSGFSPMQSQSTEINAKIWWNYLRFYLFA